MGSLSAQKGYLAITARSAAARSACAVIVLALLSPALIRACRIFLADRISRTDKSIEGYTRALGYDPGNARLWWVRGRMAHYEVEKVDLRRAADDYMKALSINPRLGQAWVDLADCWERLGAFDKADAALKMAVSVRRYSPVTRWQAGNYYLRRGDLARMHENFRTAVEYDPAKLDIAMELSWKVDGDRAALLDKLIPDTLNANLRYFQFLVARGELDLAARPWQRAMKNEVPAEEEFRTAAVFAYVDRLVSRGRLVEAMKAWNEALAKGGTGLSEGRIQRLEAAAAGAGADTGNWLWNPSFEQEILRGGFDWRYPDMPEASIQADRTNRMDGLRCLKVAFNGANVGFSHLSQIVPLPGPGSYRLEFYARCEDLTTDQRPYFMIQGMAEEGKASLRTEMLPPSSPWHKFDYLFQVNPGCQAVQIVLKRDPSSKFDNLLEGTLWLDGIGIFAAGSGGGDKGPGIRPR